ncbi:arylsulfatase regulator [Ensifer sp. SL37]|uniref:arylsulfatase regulator n=1 Tax=Ensifer sp. SL37 TaxID=2995137 RepID=UPI0022752753|nr:arylsulfatase regulator [Ensifer sp. SL37]MCY1740851.1 arylsulfatase regulator [Ensifer sp. SL37]
MTRTEMLAIIRRLDARADALLLTGADDISLFVGMSDLMPDFKALLDSSYKHEIETMGGRFPAFYRFATVLSNIAGGIADGSIKVPR